MAPWEREEEIRIDHVSRARMVGPGRLELPTLRLSGVRSNHLSYGPMQRPRSKASPAFRGRYALGSRSRHEPDRPAAYEERETETATFRTCVVLMNKPIEREALEAHP
jgi:hypothetical protein